MRILCLCPTYGRPKLVANSVACFLAQDYPAEKRKLVILDDAGQVESQDHGSWQVISTPERFPSLPSKYNAMLVAEGAIANGPCQPWSDWDAVAIWDDDDIYLPWHLSAGAAALATGAPSAKPSNVWSLYASKTPFLEDATGRFYASMAMTTERLREIGGWIDTKRADFDQSMIRLCGPATDTLPYSPGGSPSFVFRWGSTGHKHAQSCIRSSDDVGWYERFPKVDSAPVGELVPRKDEETRRVMMTVNTAAASH